MTSRTIVFIAVELFFLIVPLVIIWAIFLKPQSRSRPPTEKEKLAIGEALAEMVKNKDYKIVKLPPSSKEKKWV